MTRIIILLVLCILIIGGIFTYGMHYESLTESKNASNQILIQGKTDAKVDKYTDDDYCTNTLHGKLQPDGQCK